MHIMQYVKVVNIIVRTNTPRTISNKVSSSQRPNTTDSINSALKSIVYFHITKVFEKYNTFDIIVTDKFDQAPTY